MRVAIQGEVGSNSHLATQALVAAPVLRPCTLSAEVFESLTSGEVDAAVLPFENSLHGAVADHSDLLLQSGVVIVGELCLRIRHALIAQPGTALESVRQVFSHPVALSQCRRFFQQHAGILATPFYDTAGAVKHVRHMPAAAAIAAPFAAEVYGGEIILNGLEDDPLNFTRFFLLVQEQNTEQFRLAAEEPNKLTVAFDLPHEPGSLQKALALLAAEGADLTRIESRPVPGRPWEYMFFVDLRLPEPRAADRILRQLANVCHFTQELGRYSAAPVPSA